MRMPKPPWIVFDSNDSIKYPVYSSQVISSNVYSTTVTHFHSFDPHPPKSKIAAMDREDPIEKANPELLAYQTPLIFAFPTTLAIVKHALFEYDCTPWLAEPLRDLRLLWKIVDFASPYRREGETATPGIPLGTSSFVPFYARLSPPEDHRGDSQVPDIQEMA